MSGWRCGCGERNVVDDGLACTYCGMAADPGDLDDDDQYGCHNPSGHEWAFTGTQYGGDDTSYHGEGRCYCVHCGADGDV